MIITGKQAIQFLTELGFRDADTFDRSKLNLKLKLFRTQVKPIDIEGISLTSKSRKIATDLFNGEIVVVAKRGGYGAGIDNGFPKMAVDSLDCSML